MLEDVSRERELLRRFADGPIAIDENHRAYEIKEFLEARISKREAEEEGREPEQPGLLLRALRVQESSVL